MDVLVLWGKIIKNHCTVTREEYVYDADAYMIGMYCIWIAVFLSGVLCSWSEGLKLLKTQFPLDWYLYWQWMHLSVSKRCLSTLQNTCLNEKDFSVWGEMWNLYVWVSICKQESDS